jgi:hypothetical protein
MRGLPRWSMLHLAQAIMIACVRFAWSGASRRKGLRPVLSPAFGNRAPARFLGGWRVSS